MRIKFMALMFLIASTMTITSCSEDEVNPGEAFMIGFTIGDIRGSIDETNKTVTLELPATADITAVTPIVVVSAGATVSPESGASVDFTNPVVFTVTDNSGTVSVDYTVTIEQADLRKIAFIGVAAENTAASWDALDGSDYDLNDDQAAATWFAANVASSTTEVAYHSVEGVANGQSLSDYHAVWIQFDGGWWGGEVAQFPNNTNHCLLMESGVGFDVPCETLSANFVTAVKNYYEAGGNILFGNFAGSMVDEIGAVSSSDLAPNNNFGGINVDDGATGGAWGVRWAGDTGSPMFDGIVTSTDEGCAAPFFITLESGTLKKNRSNQYNLNFGPWAPNGDTDPLAERRASFESMTGGTILIENCGQNEPQMVEWEASGSKGTVIAILGGTYDWYVGGVANNDNIPTLTENTLLSLADKALVD
ncbi:MAG: DUF4960 domain-containing protein [Cyclobacteriaceae bacterium]